VFIFIGLKKMGIKDKLKARFKNEKRYLEALENIAEYFLSEADCDLYFERKKVAQKPRK